MHSIEIPIPPLAMNIKHYSKKDIIFYVASQPRWNPQFERLIDCFSLKWTNLKMHRLDVDRQRQFVWSNLTQASQWIPCTMFTVAIEMRSIHNVCSQHKTVTEYYNKCAACGFYEWYFSNGNKEASRVIWNALKRVDLRPQRLWRGSFKEKQFQKT